MHHCHRKQEAGNLEIMHDGYVWLSSIISFLLKLEVILDALLLEQILRLKSENFVFSVSGMKCN